ncbi:MAG: MFS transporter [Betaproteobacteria bacterium HGW-Betaproteobacteria-9]|jgi:EmrB/QacA subfamily drug resistance transporter|nr:MAG: MFS transporter [Betaproteobacteria bacterium HGW-Betaproteobacteria-9]
MIEAELPAPHRYLPWLVTIVFFMGLLDATILNSALPAMAADLGESPLNMQAAVVMYMLTLAAVIPLSGWMADRFGTRHVLQVALALFCSGSLLCALSSDLTQLVASRMLQAIGGAMLMPVGRLVVLKLYPPEKLIRVMTFITLPGLVGPLIGPALGGWLVEVASWHWIFLINLPVGVLGIVVASRVMPNLRGLRSPFDLPGFALFSGSIVLLSWGLQTVGQPDASVTTRMVCLVGGSLCLIGYWLYASRASHPLFSPALLKVPTYGLALAGNLFSRLGSSAMPFLTPLYLQVGLGYSPSAAGMTMIPAALGAMASKVIVEKLVRRFGYRSVLTANTTLLGFSIASFAFVAPSFSTVWVWAHLGFFGLFNSLQFMSMNTLTLSTLGRGEASGGNSFFMVVVQLSNGLGVALAGGLLGYFGVSALGGGKPELSGIFMATYLCVGMSTVIAAAIFLRVPRRLGFLDQPAVTNQEAAS